MQDGPPATPSNGEFADIEGGEWTPVCRHEQTTDTVK